MDLPYDVILLILDAADLDIDTRRALALKPRKLARNAAFEGKMARMHRRRSAYGSKGESAAADVDDMAIVDVVFAELSDTFFMWFMVEDEVCYMSGQNAALAL